MKLNWNKLINFCNNYIDCESKNAIGHHTHVELKINGLSFFNVGKVIFTPSRSNMSFIIFNKQGLMEGAFVCEKQAFKYANTHHSYMLLEVEFELKEERSNILC